ncbi:MAG TPA: HlyC/CorC family transporter [Rickettsiales bacterium]|nr:HlyC/CorC family transporter [Rickettsiales bacterium]
MDVELIITFFCLLMSAFFSGSETAVTAVSRERIYHLIVEGNRNAVAVGELRKKKQQFIGGIMLGNNIFTILGSSLATDFAINRWGEHGVVYATILMTALVVIFAEVLPKTYAIQNAESMALKLAPTITLALKILHPLNIALQFIVTGILRLFGVDISRSNSLASASELIRGTIELHHHEGDVVKQDRDMLGGILDMREILVSEIMAHRLNMETINADLPIEDIINLAVSSTHSRIPLWQGEPDNIIGVLHVKTLIKALRENKDNFDSKKLADILVKPWFIPESTTINNQLYEFRSQRQHLALVIDEYGVLQGLVTLEDIIEEIVGRIDDEHDKHVTSEIIATGENSYIVNGTMTIRDLNREQGWDLPDGEASTIAGLVIHEARLIPEVGEQFEFYNMRFTVLEKKGHQVTRLRIEKLEEEAPEDDG